MKKLYKGIFLDSQNTRNIRLLQYERIDEYKKSVKENIFSKSIEKVYAIYTYCSTIFIYADIVFCVQKEAREFLGENKGDFANESIFALEYFSDEKTKADGFVDRRTDIEKTINGFLKDEKNIKFIDEKKIGDIIRNRRMNLLTKRTN